MPDVTSTFFGLTIAFVTPGLVGLFSLQYWFSSTHNLFNTFETGRANAGLFFVVAIAAMAVGIVLSAVRWLVYEVLLERPFRSWVGEGSSPADRDGLWTADRLTAFRAAIDETYRYHQAYGALSVALPALLVGWLRAHSVTNWTQVGLWAVFGAVEVLLAAGALSARKRYFANTKSIFT
jgi:hypothetical protein